MAPCCVRVDELVTLYRLGAETDLSNVSVGFIYACSQIGVGFHVTLRDGSHAPPMVRFIGLARDDSQWKAQITGSLDW